MPYKRSEPYAVQRFGDSDWARFYQTDNRVLPYHFRRSNYTLASTNAQKPLLHGSRNQDIQQNWQNYSATMTWPDKQFPGLAEHQETKTASEQSKALHQEKKKKKKTVGHFEQVIN
jgi:hypothetical protein